MGYDGYNPDAGKPERELKPGRFSKRMIVGIAVALLIFTGAVFVVALCGAYIPDALIYCFFGAALGEFWALATIKKEKTKEEKRNAEADASDGGQSAGGGVQE